MEHDLYQCTMEEKYDDSKDGEDEDKNTSTTEFIVNFYHNGQE